MLDKITYEAKYKHHHSIQDIYGDVKLIKKFLNSYCTIKQSAVDEGNIDIIDMCTDFSIAIKKCNFNNKQLVRIGLWMAGYKEYEIADNLGVSRVLIHNFIDFACIKISKELMG